MAIFHHGICLRYHSFTATIFVLLLFLWVFASASSTQIGEYKVQEREKRRRGSGFGAALIIDKLGGDEKRAIGPGSLPPTCRWRCGRCNPCKAVHVAIHPGMSLPLEYYPEVWRCKCGNHLFMP